MRNPWPIFSVAAFAGAVCLVYDHFFSYETKMCIRDRDVCGECDSLDDCSKNETGNRMLKNIWKEWRDSHEK